MDRKPIVLDDTAQLEQIQTGDKLDRKACGTVSQREFDDLKERHNLLIRCLMEEGIDLPSRLLTDL